MGVTVIYTLRMFDRDIALYDVARVSCTFDFMLKEQYLLL